MRELPYENEITMFSPHIEACTEIENARRVGTAKDRLEALRYQYEDYLLQTKNNDNTYIGVSTATSHDVHVIQELTREYGQSYTYKLSPLFTCPVSMSPCRHLYKHHLGETRANYVGVAQSIVTLVKQKRPYFISGCIGQYYPIHSD